jgi:hypothetical protein
MRAVQFILFGDEEAEQLQHIVVRKVWNYTLPASPAHLRTYRGLNRTLHASCLPSPPLFHGCSGPGSSFFSGGRSRLRWLESLQCPCCCLHPVYSTAHAQAWHLLLAAMMSAFSYDGVIVTCA